MDNCGPNLTMNRNSIERRGAEAGDGYFCSREAASAVESLFSFAAELMSSLSSTSAFCATGTFLGDTGGGPIVPRIRMPSPSQLFPWGFWGKEADTRPGEGEADSASLNMRGVKAGFVPGSGGF